MPNQDNTGFWPIDRHPSTELLMDVDSANGTAVFLGDLVSVKAAGTVGPAAAGDAAIVAGSVVGIYDTNGLPAGHPEAAVSTKYLPASTAGKVLVALAIPGRRFRAQTQTGQTLTSAARMASTDHVAGAGSTTTGMSGHELNGSDLNTGAQVFIIDLYKDSNNAYGEHADYQVIFNESYWMGVGKSAGV